MHIDSNIIYSPKFKLPVILDSIYIISVCYLLNRGTTSTNAVVIKRQL